MRVSSRFTIALHILTALDTFQGRLPLTSEFLAGSVQVNPVIIRGILPKLKAAGLIRISRGRNDMSLNKAPAEITLFDVYKAIEPLENDSLFAFHKNPNPKCPVGRNIHNILDGHLTEVQNAMEEKLKSITLADILNNLKQFI